VSELISRWTCHGRLVSVPEDATLKAPIRGSPTKSETSKNADQRTRCQRNNAASNVTICLLFFEDFHCLLMVRQAAQNRLDP
jgi:hypothetical protein